MGALLALIPGKDWLYGGIIVALLIGFGWYTHRERSIGAANEVKVVQAASAKVQAAAAKQIATINAQHAATVAAIKVVQNAQLQIAAIDSAVLTQRLRNYEANRSCPVQCWQVPPPPPRVQLQVPAAIAALKAQLSASSPPPNTTTR